MANDVGVSEGFSLPDFSVVASVPRILDNQYFRQKKSKTENKRKRKKKQIRK
jgi:hypothetical protein